MEPPSPKVIEFDICGQLCPSTLLVALREINRNIAEIKAATMQLLIKSDNRNSIITIPDAAANMGLKAVVTTDGGIHSILISKG